MRGGARGLAYTANGISGSSRTTSSFSLPAVPIRTFEPVLAVFSGDYQLSLEDQMITALLDIHA